jgi:hypothetical protein
MITRLSWRLIVLLGALASVAGGATAQAAICSGTLPPGRYDSLLVPTGTCRITKGSVTVIGPVTVLKGASLIVLPPANFTVFGAVSSVNAARIDIEADPPDAVNIFGSVAITGTTREVIITDSSIDGTLSLLNSHVVSSVLARNTVTGGVNVIRNKCSNGAKCDNVAANMIGLTLVCVGNTPPPVDIGGANTVGGVKVGQCRSL